MLKKEAILFFSYGYMLLLFAIAFYGHKRAESGRSIISNPYIYALSFRSNTTRRIQRPARS